tara:strand:- start:6635 stop:6877 length:243 start_codon:yes stop_codon:yes gene_type:complete
MLLYYAIITFCLTNCSHVNEYEKYVHSEPLTYDECSAKVFEMTQIILDITPDIKHRKINQLCVQKDALTNLDRYEIFNGY